MKFLQILALMLALAAFANAHKAFLSGVVMDELGAVIPNAEIKVKEKGGKTFSARSKKDGTYRLELKNGIYQIEFIREPFQSFVVVDYLVAENQKMQMDVALLCKDCEIIEHQSTINQKETIQIPQTKISEKISVKTLEKMPKKQNKINRKNNVNKQ